MSLFFAVILLGQLPPSFTPWGWYTATFDGTTYTASLGHSLPAGWSYSNYETVGTQISGSTSASRGPAGTAQNDTSGIVTFTYRLISGVIPQQGQYMLINLDSRNSAFASGSVLVSGRTGKSEGRAEKVAAGISVGPNPEQKEKNKGPSGNRAWYTLPNLNWQPYPYRSGLYQAFINYKSPTLVAEAKATNPESSEGISVTTYGIGVHKTKPHGLSVKSSGASPGWVEGTTNAYEWLYIDIFNMNNAPVENISSNVIDGGAWTVGFQDYKDGSYKLYGHAFGSLRKRVDITYSSSSGLAGIVFTLKFGDADGDNYVSEFEVDYIYSKIGMKAVDWGWLGGDGDDSALCPADCDFDRDGEITIADYNLASPNVGQYGD